MFYSHSLLARKEPLGQIWMAATMHAKMNRRNLNQIDLIRICEEILNPRAPMALRLSSILMGGVVIVYERKVKLLFDDVHRFLDQLNEAWKKGTKPSSDSTVLPKRRAQAKSETLPFCFVSIVCVCFFRGHNCQFTHRKEAITLPEVDIERQLSVDFTQHATLFQQQTGYFLMQLDSVDVGEPVHDNAAEGDHQHNLHQADLEDITLPKQYDPSNVHADLFNRHYERFEIEGDDLDFTSGEPTHMRPPSPNNLIPSPPPTPQDQRPDGDLPDNVVDEMARMQDIAQKPQQRQRRSRKRRSPASVMDNDQTVHPAHVYQSWLRDTSDIVSRRRRNQKPKNKASTMKIGKLLEQPASVFMGHLFKPGSGEVYYPSALLELFKEKLTHDSPPARAAPPESSSWSPPGRQTHQDLPVEDLHSGGGSQSFLTPIEKLRANLFDNDAPPPDIMDELRANLNGIRGSHTNSGTPTNSGHERRSVLSSTSGKGVNKNSSEVDSGRKRRFSSRHSSDGLEPVSEDIGYNFSDPNFKLSKLSGNGPTPEQDLLMETGPTQTQQPIINQPLERVTDAIRMELKSYFETPGGPQVESLNKLTDGLNRRGAAMMFYQTCVLATRNFVKVEQSAPYEDILITRGPNM